MRRKEKESGEEKNAIGRAKGFFLTAKKKLKGSSIANGIKRPYMYSFSVGSTGTLWSKDTIVTLLKERYSIERGSTEKEVWEDRSPAGLTKTHTHMPIIRKRKRDDSSIT